MPIDILTLLDTTRDPDSRFSAAESLAQELKDNFYKPRTIVFKEERPLVNMPVTKAERLLGRRFSNEAISSPQSFREAGEQLSQKPILDMFIDYLQFIFKLVPLSRSKFNWPELEGKQDTLEEVQALNVEISFWEKFQAILPKLRPTTKAMLDNLYQIHAGANQQVLKLLNIPERDPLYAVLMGWHVTRQITRDTEGFARRWLRRFKF